MSAPISEAMIVHQVRDTLPFVVRLSPWRFAWRTTFLFMIFMGVVGAAVALMVVSDAGPSGLLTIPAFAAVGLLIMPILAWEARKPVLGADQAGIWVRVLRARKTVFLSWEAVTAVTIGRSGFHDELSVVARDPGVDAALAPVAQGNGLQRGAQAVANSRARRKLGTNIHTPLTGAPLSNEDVLAQLRYYAAGRCPVG